MQHCCSPATPTSQENSTTCPVTTSAPPSGLSNGGDIAIGIIFALLFPLAVVIAVAVMVHGVAFDAQSPWRRKRLLVSYMIMTLLHVEGTDACIYLCLFPTIVHLLQGNDKTSCC